MTPYHFLKLFDSIYSARFMPTFWRSTFYRKMGEEYSYETSVATVPDICGNNPQACMQYESPSRISHLWDIILVSPQTHLVLLVFSWYYKKCKHKYNRMLKSKIINANSLIRLCCSSYHLPCSFQSPTFVLFLLHTLTPYSFKYKSPSNLRCIQFLNLTFYEKIRMVHIPWIYNMPLFSMGKNV
jgi:hypothetical protein